MSPYRIRMSPDVGCDHVLWPELDRPLPATGEEADAGELEHVLPISERLRERLLAWAGMWVRYENGEDVSLTGFHETGLWLSRELQVELGPAYSVRYCFSSREERTRLRPLAERSPHPGWRLG